MPEPDPGDDPGGEADLGQPCAAFEEPASIRCYTSSDNTSTKVLASNALLER
jgi:hypothetical protein